jgi:hypothetical protein
MNDNKRWDDVNKTDTVICVSLGAIWFFLLWLASNHLALVA